MTDWKSVAAAIAPDIPEDQLERIGPLLDRMRAAFLEQTGSVGVEIEPSYIQAVQEMEL
ncbi:MAG: hypothetical protein IT168_05365 [Bryobacterales bacterium]|nr:hypothetical protein [Bryobacterales bacterium]